MLQFSLLLSWLLLLPPQDPAETSSTQLVLELRRWSDQEPPAGATVTAHWGIRNIYVNDAHGDRPGRMVRGVVSREGRCELEVPAGEVILVYVEPGEDTRLTRIPVEEPLLTGERRVIEAEVYPLGIPVSGKVVDDQGRPVAGVRVVASWGSEDWSSGKGKTRAAGLVGLGPPADRECWSDDQGEFRLAGLAGPEFLHGMKADWMLVASSDSLLSLNRVQITPRFAGANVAGIELKVAPARPLIGKVIGPDGEPLAGAVVYVSSFGPGGMQTGAGSRGASSLPPAAIGPPLESGADGSFLIPALVEGRWTLRAFLEGQPDATVTVGKRDRMATVSFVRGKEDALVTLEGTVRSERGDPIEGAKVLYAKWTDRMVETDATGHFRMTGIDPKKLKFALTFHAPGYALNGMVPKKGEDGVLPIDVVLKEELTLSGRVVGPDGAPRKGLKILASAVAPPGEELPYWKANMPHSGFDLAHAVTGRSGEFEFTALWEGDWLLRVMKESRISTSPLAIRTVPAGTRDLRIRIGGDVVRDGKTVRLLGDGMNSFEGRLVDSVTSEPVRGFFVHPGKHPNLEQWIDNEEGEFRFESLSEGSWSFYFKADGYVQEDSRRLVLPHEGEPVLFQLGKPVDVDLRVWDSLGAPVHLAFLDARGLNGDRLAAQWIEPLGVTDHGEATLKGLPIGEIVLLVCPPGSGVEFEFPVDLRQGFADGLDFDLPADFSSPRQVLEVVLRTAQGFPLAESFCLQATDEEGDVVASWSVGFWRDGYSITAGHDLMSFVKPRPRSKDSVVPFELPPGRFRLSVIGDGWEQQGPEVVVRPDRAPDGLTIVIEAR